MQMTGLPYWAQDCRCLIHDTCCITCKSEVGYKVTVPCRICEDSRGGFHTTHRWIFYDAQVEAIARDQEGSSSPLVWDALDTEEEEDLERERAVKTLLTL